MAVEVKGLAELKRKFEEIPKVLRRRVLRNALAEGARLVRDEAKRNAPVLQNAMKAPYRTRGTVKNAIKVRTSKMDRRAGNVGVFVNVKPADRNNRGAKSPNDPFYWRWLEFGRKARAGQSARLKVKRFKAGSVLVTKGVRFRRALRTVGAIAPMRFMQKGAEKLGAALTAFEDNIARWMTKIDAGAPIK
jgi:HK97 gp10 family phage protein